LGVVDRPGGMLGFHAMNSASVSVGAPSMFRQAD
jgi:hypothetical protein